MSSQLDHYLQQATTNLYAGHEGNLASISATLDTNMTNYVLIFRGAFNPPHLGHLRVLANAFYHHNTNLHIVGAIIVPMDDTYHESKNAYTGERFILPKSHSASLWREDKRFFSWAWVFDLDKHDAVPPFVRELRGLALREGIRLSFVHLRGAENFYPTLSLRWLGECDTMYVTDVGRESPKIGLGRLPEVDGCGEWRSVPQPWDTDRMVGHLVTVNNLPSLGIFHEYAALDALEVSGEDNVFVTPPQSFSINSMPGAFDTYDALPADNNQNTLEQQGMLQAIKVAMSRRLTTSVPTHVVDSNVEPGHRIYFIAETDRSYAAMSSSKVREHIRFTPRGELMELLEREAMSPGLLMEMLTSSDPSVRMTERLKFRLRSGVEVEADQQEQSQDLAPKISTHQSACGGSSSNDEVVQALVNSPSTTALAFKWSDIGVNFQYSSAQLPVRMPRGSILRSARTTAGYVVGLVLQALIWILDAIGIELR